MNRQALQVGDRVFFEVMDPAVRDVYKKNKTSYGYVRMVYVRFLGFEMEDVVYQVRLERPVLSEVDWSLHAKPGEIPTWLRKAKPKRKGE